MDIKNITVGIFTLIVSCTFTSCSFDDNYDGPNASFHGQLIDDITNGPMYSEQPNGFQIRFKEVSWGPDAQPQTFQGKPDGSFNWEQLFGYTDRKYENSPYGVATYEVEPFDGAFDIVGDSKKIIEVSPGARVEVNFNVIPFISLTEEHSLDGTNLTVKYTMNRNNDHKAIRVQKAGVIISSRTKYLSGGLNVGGYEEQYSKFKSAPQLMTYVDGREFVETIALDPGKTYRMRIGAKLTGSERWNYTETIEISVP